MAAAAGAAVPLHPIAPLALLGTLGAILYLAQGTRATTTALVALFGLLIGYAFLGRGLAYAGVSPAYIGEGVLALAVLGMIASLPRGRLGKVDLLLLGFMAWGALRAISDLGTYGIDTLRDSVTWGYAAFAIFVSLTLQAHHIRTAVTWYARVVPALVVWIPALALVWYQFGTILPTVPGPDVRIPHFKAGDMAVHLAGVAAFLVGGLYQHRVWHRVTEPLVWLCWLVGVAMTSAVNRGGMVALGLAAMTVLFLVRSFDRIIPVLVISLLMISVALSIDVEIEAQRGRTVSIRQLIDNVQSVIAETDQEGLSGTREWREAWWDAVIDYTIHGAYFWDGKGYGINLADDDGFRSEGSALRAPHNAHLQFLARGGVPTLVGWVILQLAFAATLIRSGIRSARRGQHYWFGVHVWIVAYWLAALTNMSFDVYLEGPQGGIMFWSLYGAGLALAKVTAPGDRLVAAEPDEGSRSPPSSRPTRGVNGHRGVADDAPRHQPGGRETSSPGSITSVPSGHA